jgi:hypothetical protein
MHMTIPFFFLLGLAILFTLVQIIYKNQRFNVKKYSEIFLSYILFFYVGFGSFIATYGHIFNSIETAELIGWPPSPFFQFELGITSLAFGTLGILARWIKGRFWEATITGWSIFLLGCFIGHIISYNTIGDVAPLNFGAFLWFNDFFMPLLTIALLIFIRFKKK